MEDKNVNNERVNLEDALDKVGFGPYSYLITSMTGVAIISYVCIGYGSTMIVPTSACELQTTTAQQGLLAAGPVIGSIFGGIVWGYLADTKGRRKMMLASLVGSAVINGLASLSVNWVMLMIMQIIASLFASGLYSMSMALLSECVPMAKRNSVVLLVSSIFLMSQGFMAVMAIPVIPLTFSYHLPSLGIYWNSWRTLMVIYSLPSLITATWLYFMQESPKFVFIKGDEDGALDILRTIHRINHCNGTGELQVYGLLKEEDDKSSKSDGSESFKDMFKSPLLKYTVIVTLLMIFKLVGAFHVWQPTIVDKFVRNLESDDGSNYNLCAILDRELEPVEALDVAPCSLNATSLLIVFGIAVLTSVCNVFISFIVEAAGRRNVIIGITALCGLSGILVNLIPNAVGSVVMFAISNVGIVVLGLYTAIMVALFPTHLKALAIAMFITIGRLATFTSIQVLNYLLRVNCDAGFYLFSALFASSAIMALFLPDDRTLAKPEEEEEKKRRVTATSVTGL